MGDSEAAGLGGLTIGGLFGYLIGSQKYAQWDSLITAFTERLKHLAYFRVLLPYNFYNLDLNYKILYLEGINTYLLGCPNASLPLMVRCLEISLKKKYSEIEKKEPEAELMNLLNWAEKFLKEKKEIAHGFRILRNFIHTQKLIKEQDALEAISHISSIINILYSLPDKTNLQVYCNNCKELHYYHINTIDCFIGNNMSLNCDKSKVVINHTILP